MGYVLLVVTGVGCFLLITSLLLVVVVKLLVLRV